ncbi:MAG: DNA primase [Chitinophagia bacterium]|nr:DNA primase [Chitinophagia bacterium]
MIAPQSIQEVLDRIDIIDVVGQFVKLKRRGSNHIGLCPFHHEKTPSFSVSQAKEIYKCFGCGRSGNTIGFLMEHEKYSYVEAIRWLASRYGVELEETDVSPEHRQQQQQAESLFILNAFARDHFARQLTEDGPGTDIGLSYLHERGFTDETIRHFQLGYCPDTRDGFATAAIRAQYSPELLQKSGLVVMRDGQPVDNYRGRIIFPIHNQSGKVIGFGARIIARNDRAPKYINTPENEVYVKSRILYGSYFARHGIDKANECLLVEGYTDVIALHQAGITNAVASGGTSLTTDQLRLIKKYTSNLTIIYDGDNAGIKAALRGLDLALEEGLNVRLVLLPDGDDPDSFVHKKGPEELRAFIESNRKDVILFQLEVALKEAGQDSQKKAALVSQIAESISRLNKAEDFTRQQDYIHRSSELLGIDEQGLTSLVNKIIRERLTKDERKSRVPEPLPDTEPSAEKEHEDAPSLELVRSDEPQERWTLRALLEFGGKAWDAERTVAEYVFHEFDENDILQMIDNPGIRTVIERYRRAYEAGEEMNVKRFLYHEDPEVSRTTISSMEAMLEISPRWSEHYELPLPTREDLYREEVMSCLTYLKLRKIKRLIVENQRDMAPGRSDADLEAVLETHQYLKRLEMELTRTLGTVIIR